MSSWQDTVDKYLPEAADDSFMDPSLLVNDDEDDEDYVPESLRGFFAEAEKTLEAQARDILEFAEDKPRHTSSAETEGDLLEATTSATSMQPQQELSFASPSLMTSPEMSNPAADLTASQAKHMAMEGSTPREGGEVLGRNLQLDLEQEQITLEEPQPKQSQVEPPQQPEEPPRKDPVVVETAKAQQPSIPVKKEKELESSSSSSPSRKVGALFGLGKSNKVAPSPPLPPPKTASPSPPLSNKKNDKTNSSKSSTPVSPGFSRLFRPTSSSQAKHHSDSTTPQPPASLSSSDAKSNSSNNEPSTSKKTNKTTKTSTTTPTKSQTSVVVTSPPSSRLLQGTSSSAARRKTTRIEHPPSPPGSPKELQQQPPPSKHKQTQERPPRLDSIELVGGSPPQHLSSQGRQNSDLVRRDSPPLSQPSTPLQTPREQPPVAKEEKPRPNYSATTPRVAEIEPSSSALDDGPSPPPKREGDAPPQQGEHSLARGDEATEYGTGEGTSLLHALQQWGTSEDTTPAPTLTEHNKTPPPPPTHAKSSSEKKQTPPSGSRPPPSRPPPPKQSSKPSQPQSSPPVRRPPPPPPQQQQQRPQPPAQKLPAYMMPTEAASRKTSRTTAIPDRSQYKNRRRGGGAPPPKPSKGTTQTSTVVPPPSSSSKPTTANPSPSNAAVAVVAGGKTTSPPPPPPPPQPTISDASPPVASPPVALPQEEDIEINAPSNNEDLELDLARGGVVTGTSETAPNFRAMRGTTWSTAKRDRHPRMDIRTPTIAMATPPPPPPTTNRRLFQGTASSNSRSSKSSSTSSATNGLAVAPQLPSRLLQGTEASLMKVETTPNTAEVAKERERIRAEEAKRRKEEQRRVQLRNEERKRKQLETAEKTKASLARAKSRRERAEALERERLEKVKEKIAQKENRSRKNDLKQLQKLDLRPSAPPKKKYSLTVPVGPKFATDSRMGETRVSSSAATKKASPPAQPQDVLRKSLRTDSFDNSSRSNTAPVSLTIPQGPNLSTSKRHVEKTPIPDADVIDSMAQMWEAGLRAFDALPEPEKGPHKLTIPVTPKFSKMRQREPAKSTAEKETETMEFYKTHPFKAKPVRMHDYSPALPRPPKSERRITTPQPFHLRTETRVHKNLEKEVQEITEAQAFRARPMPDFSGIKNIPITGKTPETAKDRLTKPQPFHFYTDDRIAASSPRRQETPTEEAGKSFKARPMPDFAKSSPKIQTIDPSRLSKFRPAKDEPEVKPMAFKARPMPNFSSESPIVSPRAKNKITLRTSSGAKSSWSTISSTPDEVEPATKKFKARPLPKFDRPHVLVSPRTPRTASAAKSTASTTSSFADEAEPAAKFKARPMPKFDRPQILVSPRNPNRLRSNVIIGPTFDDNEVVSPEFKARPLPDFSRPAVPVKGRDPGKLKPPSAEKRSNFIGPTFDDNEDEPIFSGFKAKPLPDLSRPSMPVKDRNPARLRTPEKVKPREPGPPPSVEPIAAAPVFKAKPLPDLSRPSMPVKDRDPAKLRTPEKVKPRVPGPPPSVEPIVTPVFKAKPLPDLSRPSMPVKDRDPARLRTPEKLKPRVPGPPPSVEPIVTPVFKAKPLPDLSRPSMPVKDRNPIKLRSPDKVKRAQGTSGQDNMQASGPLPRFATSTGRPRQSPAKTPNGNSGETSDVGKSSLRRRLDEVRTKTATGGAGNGLSSPPVRVPASNQQRTPTNSTPLNTESSNLVLSAESKMRALELKAQALKDDAQKQVEAHMRLDAEPPRASPPKEVATPAVASTRDEEEEELRKAMAGWGQGLFMGQQTATPRVYNFGPPKISQRATAEAQGGEASQNFEDAIQMANNVEKAAQDELSLRGRQDEESEGYGPSPHDPTNEVFTFTGR